MRAAFEVFEPAGIETPVVVEVPHAGLDLPAPFLEPLAAPARAIGRDADLYVDALYEEAPQEGAHLLVARASRYVVDVNRAETDVDAEVVEGARSDVRMHHGLVWRTTSEGEAALGRKLTKVELEERLELVWRPYHRVLAALVERKVARFGIAVVLAAHSMPSVDRMPVGALRHDGADRMPSGAGRQETPAGDRDQRPPPSAGGRPSTRELAGPQSHSVRGPSSGRPRADVVPGTRGRKSSAGQFIDAVEAMASARGWSVRHDEPYAGGYTTQHYGRPAAGVHVVQVELARRLYLDEATLRPGPDFAGVRGWCRGLVRELGRLAQGAT
jgi:N-formylglutamate amidohydrolase